MWGGGSLGEAGGTGAVGLREVRDRGSEGVGVGRALAARTQTIVEILFSEKGGDFQGLRRISPSLAYKHIVLFGVFCIQIVRLLDIQLCMFRTNK